MKKIIGAVVFSFCIAALASAQTTHRITGIIYDQQGETLPGASVWLVSCHEGGVTDERGYFMVTDVPSGIHNLKVTYIGFQSYSDTLHIHADTTLIIKLKPALQNLQEVVITDHYAEERKQNSSLNLEIVNNEYLRRNNGGSLMQSLSRLPGVATIEIGSGQSKPVIRGLGFNRVAVVENGIKHQGQQWGDDHGLEIDQYAVDRVEIIKGPASLKYGSDAMGGVVDLSHYRKPLKQTVGGGFTLNYKSNNQSIGASAIAYVRKEAWYYTLRATWIQSGDYRVPTDTVDIYGYRAALDEGYMRNTAGKEFDLHATVGYETNSLSNRLILSTVNTETGFFANAHGLEPRNVNNELHDVSNRDILYPYHAVNHYKATNETKWKKPRYNLTAELGFQINLREERSQYVSHGYMPPVFPENMPFDSDLERAFDKKTGTANLTFQPKTDSKLKWETGLNSEYQLNNIDGRGFIIPAYDQWAIGGYGYLRYAPTETQLVHLGLRYDYGQIKTNEYEDWFDSPAIIENDTVWEPLVRAEALNRSFSNITWSVGYNLNLERIALKINAGKSFRMPIPKELAANGVNYHRFSFEVGDADLNPEQSYQLDVGIDYSTSKLAVGINPFINYFSNYIYLNPTPYFDRLYGNGNQVFIYTQSEVLRFGGEIHAHLNILKRFELGIIGDWIYANQLSGPKKGFGLPFSPAPKVIFNLKYKPRAFAFLTAPYVSVDVNLVAEQNRIVPPEEKTPGYQTLNLSLGSDLKLKHTTVSINLQVINVFDTFYFNHTNYYRLINAPEPGRNFIVSMYVPFSGHLKHTHEKQ